MANMPVCNFKSAAPCSPFLVEENANNVSGKKPKVHGYVALKCILTLLNSYICDLAFMSGFFKRNIQSYPVTNLP